MKQRQLLVIAIIYFCFFFNGCKAQNQNNAPTLIASISLPGVAGRIDHLAVDNKTGVVYVAALGNNSVEVVDLKTKKVIHSIKELHEPQGIAFISANNSLFVANGDNGECDVFNASSFQKVTSLMLSGDADNVRYDSIGKKIYVGYGNGGIAIIDAITFRLISEIKFSGHPESFQLDKLSKKIYVNIPDEKQIDIIELPVGQDGFDKDAVIDQWKITAAGSNFPMSLDEINNRLFVGCRHSPRLLVINTKTGKTIASFSIDGDTDDIFYNKMRKEIYVSCGQGFVDVFKQSGPDTYIPNGKISTHSGARTSLFIPELNQLIVASPAGFGREACLLVYPIK